MLKSVLIYMSQLHGLLIVKVLWKKWELKVLLGLKKRILS